MGNNDFYDAIERQVKEQFDRTVEIPEGLTEDEAVRFVIDQYKQMTGADLADEDVRTAVREEMSGRELT